MLDPIEIMETRIDNMADRVFSGVPDGKARCMGCEQIVDIDDLHQVNERPDSPVACGDCINPHKGGEE